MAVRNFIYRVLSNNYIYKCKTQIVNVDIDEGVKFLIEVFNLGDIVEMKKQHPCGSNKFEIIRVGADIKIKCTQCGRIVMIPRSKFQKEAKKIVINAES